MDFKERLKLIRGDTLQEVFAAEIGVHKNTYASWERGKSAPRQPDIARMLELRPDISPEWLLTGEGPMVRQDAGDPVRPRLDGPGDPRANIVESEHMSLIRGFRDKGRALNINRGLMELEKLDTEAFQRVEYYIKGAVDTLRMIKDRTPDRRSGSDRRHPENPESPPDGKDRRRGRDRRQATGS